MDYKADRIADYMVYYLSQSTDNYEKYMRIPLTQAASNITDCLPWMVYYADFLSLQFSFYVIFSYC